MKRSTAISLVLYVCALAGLVAYATTSLVGPNGSTDAWLNAHRQTPVLWALDAASLLAVILAAVCGGQSLRLDTQNAEVTKLNDEHRMQLEAMLRNAEKDEQTEAAQTDTVIAQEEKIVAQQETIRSLSEQAAVLQKQVDELRGELDARSAVFETEARRLTEQAFRALSGQMDANTRQLDAVNLALQYHRADIQQLRNSLRTVQLGSEPARVARLTPAELAAISKYDIHLFAPDAQLEHPEDPRDEQVDAAAVGSMPPGSSDRSAVSANPPALAAEESPRGEPERKQSGIASQQDPPEAGVSLDAHPEPATQSATTVLGIVSAEPIYLSYTSQEITAPFVLEGAYDVTDNNLDEQSQFDDEPADASQEYAVQANAPVTDGSSATPVGEAASSSLWMIDEFDDDNSGVALPADTPAPSADTEQGTHDAPTASPERPPNKLRLSGWQRRL